MLGDAILELIIQGNLVHTAIREKHLDSLKATGISKDLLFDPIEEPFKAFHAHQAKSFLAKNVVLSKLMCLFGLHQCIITNKQ